jgi:hypothetical protein
VHALFFVPKIAADQVACALKSLAPLVLQIAEAITPDGWPDGAVGGC